MPSLTRAIVHLAVIRSLMAGVTAIRIVMNGDLASSFASVHPKSANKTHLHSKPLFERDCSKEDCAGGQAWGYTIYYAFTRAAQRKWSWSSRMVQLVHAATDRLNSLVPCIHFEHLDVDIDDVRTFKGAPLDGVIVIDSDGMNECSTDVMGFPGLFGLRHIKLGLCGQYERPVVHEFLHALGVNHEQNRMNSSKRFDGHGPYIKFTDPGLAKDAQFAPQRNAYVGSVARGGHAPFNFASIMMYKTDGKFHTNPDGKYDHMTGGEELTDGDLAQLKDIYGCLEPLLEPVVCPTTAADRQVDGNGDCSCPARTSCKINGAGKCPSSRGSSTEYFAAGCATCMCVAQRCPGGNAPFANGDCSCSPKAVCVQDGHRGCASSRTGRDLHFFHSSCKNCKCVPRTCSRESGAQSWIPNDEVNCECPRDSICQDHSLGWSGCRITNDGIAMRYFSPSCTTCQCKSEWALRLSCPSTSASASPDAEGDCDCPFDKRCYFGGSGKPCPYSGGVSYEYFSQACKDCHCMPPLGQPSSDFIPYRFIHSKHEHCTTKCGATMVTADPFQWDIHGMALEEDKCGQCKAVQISTLTDQGSDVPSCQDYGMDNDFEIFASHGRHLLCCRKLGCVLEEQSCEKRKRICEEHADCVYDRDSRQSSCQCHDGYEATFGKLRKDGRKCSPIKPAGARCCFLSFMGSTYYMWVPKKYLTKMGKCLTTSGVDKWHHAKDDQLCEENRFVYGLEGFRTPKSI